MANAQFWQAEHKVYPPSKIHPGVHKGYIRTGVIHNLIRLCPLTALQFWTPMVALASYATWRYRAEVAEWLDNLFQRGLPEVAGGEGDCHPPCRDGDLLEDRGPRPAAVAGGERPGTGDAQQGGQGLVRRVGSKPPQWCRGE
eukprot:GGOE01004403.1.p1 GENE.GGOE01004403.1~~GGOE01004403.1.p1  ORF type:complete len:154 (-),score=6.44 GGOE01004403.1:237-662(-)